MAEEHNSKRCQASCSSRLILSRSVFSRAHADAVSSPPQARAPSDGCYATATHTSGPRGPRRWRVSRTLAFLLFCSCFLSVLLLPSFSWGLSFIGGSFFPPCFVHFLSIFSPFSVTLVHLNSSPALFLSSTPFPYPSQALPVFDGVVQMLDLIAVD